MTAQFDYTVTPNGVKSRRMRHWMDAVHHNVLKTMSLVLLDLNQSRFGLYLGNFWLILEPLLQAGTYYFLLTIVFRISGADTSFAFFFVPVTFWRSHATLVSSAPYFMSSKGHPYVEQGFGLLTAYLETAANEIVLMAVRLCVLCTFLIIAGFLPHWTWLLVPGVIAVQMLFSMALHIWLSMFGVAFKDYGKLVSHFVWLWWYMSPGLYNIGRIPDWPIWAKVIYFSNPFAYIIPAYHSVMLDGVITLNLTFALIVIALGSLVLIWVGARRLNSVGYQMAQFL